MNVLAREVRRSATKFIIVVFACVIALLANGCIGKISGGANGPSGNTNANADLSSLVLSNCTLTPTFDSSVLSYTAAVTNDISSVTVTPTSADGGAVITVQGTVIASGMESQSIALDVGDNTITIEITATDGHTQKSYSIVVTRGAAPSVKPDLDEEFDFQWQNDGSYSPDGLWCRSSWPATGNNLFTFNNAIIQSSYPDAKGGVLLLTIQAALSTDKSCYQCPQGGELQSVGAKGSSFGYGYYEARMQLSSVQDGCVSFFWIQGPSYGPEEIDIEFLTDTQNSGTVDYSVHMPNSPEDHQQIKLGFDPSQAFHRYGFLWTQTFISYTVDGQIVHTVNKVDNNFPSHTGYIMMNAWSGSVYWGGGPPAKDETSVYDWVKFYKDATEVPAE